MDSTKQWIDVPGGWAFGWPKLYDSEKEGNLQEFLKANGYSELPVYIRSWDAKAEGE